jgi:hypothetical protein
MQSLLLQEAQVHSGMIVALVPPDQTEPAVDEQGPLLLQALMGGIPIHKKFYVLGGRPQLFQKSDDGWKSEPLTDQQLGISPVQGMEGFNQGVRFQPIYTFGPAVAPRNMQFVVYLDGQRLQYPSGKNNVYVRTDAQGHILSHNGYEYDLWQQEYALPHNAVLIPISRIQVTEVPHEPAVVYKGPEREWMTVLPLLAGEAAMFGIRIFDAHRELQFNKRGPYLHLGLEGGMAEETRKRFAARIVGQGLGDYLFTNQCPYCWQTITRESRL